MAVKVLIKRKVAEKNIPELDALLRKMRALTLSRKGYISGESFNRVDEAGVSMVISNGAVPEHLYDIVEGKPVGTKFVGRKRV